VKNNSDTQTVTIGLDSARLVVMAWPFGRGLFPNGVKADRSKKPLKNTF
jgi:hypothetical protein